MNSGAATRRRMCSLFYVRWGHGLSEAFLLGIVWNARRVVTPMADG